MLRDWLRQDWTTPQFGDLGGAIFADKSALGILRAITHNDRGGGRPLSTPGGPVTAALLQYLPAWPALSPPVPTDDHHVVIGLTSCESSFQARRHQLSQRAHRHQWLCQSRTDLK